MEATRETLVFAVLPLREAVRVAVLSAGIAATLMLNVVEVAPAATVADSGAVNGAPTGARVSAVPPAGAGIDTARVQVLVELGPIAGGEH